MTPKLTIYCDGGARGNPGPAASAFVVLRDGREIYSQGNYLKSTTNNVAEYNAVLTALVWLDSQKLTNNETVFVLDSELVVRQLTGVYKIKNENLKNYAIKIKSLEKKFDSIKYQNVLREKNKRADFLVNQTIDENAHVTST